MLIEIFMHQRPLAHLHNVAPPPAPWSAVSAVITHGRDSRGVFTALSSHACCFYIAKKVIRTVTCCESLICSF